MCGTLLGCVTRGWEEGVGLDDHSTLFCLSNLWIHETMGAQNLQPHGVSVPSSPHAENSPSAPLLQTPVMT